MFVSVTREKNLLFMVHLYLMAGALIAQCHGYRSRYPVCYVLNIDGVTSSKARIWCCSLGYWLVPTVLFVLVKYAQGMGL